MIDDLTPDSVASEVKLLRDDIHYDGTFLFVEGETDAIFFSNFIDSSNCQIRFLLGKDNVLSLVSSLERDGVSGFLAILDADFWHFENVKHPSNNICVTDFHDVEIMLLTSPALDKLLKEYIPSTKLNALSKVPQGIRYSIFAAASHIGKLRWVSYKYGLNISFYNDAQKTTYIDWENAIGLNHQGIFVDSSKLMDVVCPSISFRQIVRERLSRDALLKNYDMQQLCNGHDAVYVVYALIKKQGRGKEVTNLAHKTVEKSLRLAYENQYFIKTNLYKQIWDWQEKNGKPILAVI